MIESKQDLKEYLDAELGFYKANPAAAFFGASESAILRRHQRLLRKAEYHVNTGHKLRGLFFRFLLKRIQLRYSLQIPLNAFGKGLHIMHLGPILVNGLTKAGERCSIHIFTSLVSKRGSGAPILGNGVVIGVGASVVGSVTVADNVVIGANSVVTHDVTEPDISVAGAPAKKVSDRGRIH